MSSYCISSQDNPYHKPYHDTEYGFPNRSDAVLFERLILEINQAGLSWLTILRKREAFCAAYAGFAIDAVAGFGADDRARLLADAGIIRNRKKVDAAIENARRCQGLIDGHGSLAAWLDAHHPLTHPDWLKLFRATFVFTGPEVVKEFLMSLGYLPGAHAADCDVGRHLVEEIRPPWVIARESGFSFEA